jgi:transketolase
VGGSADLAPSNNSNLAYGSFTSQTPEGRTIHFGVREHAMGAMVNGMTLHSGLKVFGATFLVFSDYMRPPIRLASLMKIPPSSSTPMTLSSLEKTDQHTSLWSILLL